MWRHRLARVRTTIATTDAATPVKATNPPISITLNRLKREKSLPGGACIVEQMPDTVETNISALCAPNGPQPVSCAYDEAAQASEPWKARRHRRSSPGYDAVDGGIMSRAPYVRLRCCDLHASQ